MLGKSAPLSLQLGQLGSDLIVDTNAHTGDWGIITCIASCTFTTLTSGKLHDGTTACMSGDLTEIALSPGMSIYGRFVAITLATGKVIAYRL